MHGQVPVASGPQTPPIGVVPNGPAEQRRSSRYHHALHPAKPAVLTPRSHQAIKGTFQTSASTCGLFNIITEPPAISKLKKRDIQA